MSTHDPNVLPPDLPVPVDDGAASHLLDAPLPPFELEATDGSRVYVESPPAFAAFLKAEIAKWSRVVREAGITAG